MSFSIGKKKIIIKIGMLELKLGGCKKNNCNNKKGIIISKE